MAIIYSYSFGNANNPSCIVSGRWKYIYKRNILKGLFSLITWNMLVKLGFGLLKITVNNEWFIFYLARLDLAGKILY